MSEKPYLFEVSWEVANKVGGIYTVLESKSALVKEEYGDHYFFVGPYLPGKSDSQFIPKPMPTFLANAQKDLAPEGIQFHYGTWLLDSEPQVILVEFMHELNNIGQFKSELWNTYWVDSLFSAYDFDEPVAFSWAVGKLLESIKRVGLKKDKVIVHAHEWLTGAVVLYLKHTGLDFSTIFTTHATFLGRCLASSGINFYADINSIDADAKAAEIGIMAKHSLEKATAIHVDVLTTVSEITGKEAEAFYGRKPDVILPNGLNMTSFPGAQDITVHHRDYRKFLRMFTQYYFFPHYTFDLENTLYYFILGRYEMRCKGIDLFIDALADLNQKLKAKKSDKTIVALFCIPAGSSGVKDQLIESKSIHQSIRQTVHHHQDDIFERIVRAYLGEHEFDLEWLLSKDFIDKAVANQRRFKRMGRPPLVTHDLFNEDGDEIINMFKRKGLLNAEEDKVKVVFYPTYLSGGDGLLNLQFYNVMAGSHFGVFPSFYEPWGYTPLEAGALGVASVTTDLSGYGLALKEAGLVKKKLPGTYVISRSAFDYDSEKEELLRILYEYSTLDGNERMELRLNANTQARNYDWKILVKYYFEAHRLALAKSKVNVA
ncbi:MAG TPA: glycogen/starch synthase [Candidatus Aquicultor sp.]|jgi:glycogen(starch) synthase